MPRTPGRRTRSVSSYRAPRVRVGMNPLCEEQGTAVASDSGPERCVHHLHPEERSNGIQRKVPLPSVARGEQDARAGCPNNSLVRTRVRAVTLKLPDGRGGTKPKKKRKEKKSAETVAGPLLGSEDLVPTFSTQQRSSSQSRRFDNLWRNLDRFAPRPFVPLMYRARNLGSRAANRPPPLSPHHPVTTSRAPHG